MPKSLLNYRSIFFKKRFFSFLFLGLCSFLYYSPIYAQSSSVDSIDWMIDSTGDLSSELQKKFLDRAFIIAKQEQLVNKEAVVLQSMSNWELDQANYFQAITNLDSFEQLVNAYDLEELKGQQYFIRGSIYLQLKKVEQAKLLFQDALVQFRRQSDTLSMGGAYTNIGIVEMLLGNDSIALSNYEKAKVIFSKYELEDKLSLLLNNIGYLYLNQHNPKKALTIFEEFLSVAKKNNKKIGEAKAYGNLAYTYFLLKDYPQAFLFYEKSIDLAKKEGFNDVLAISYKDLAETYETKGDTKNALKTFRLYLDTHLKNVGAETQKKVSELEVKYETALKDQQIAEQAQAIHTLKQEKVIRQQRFWLIVTSLTSLLTIFSFLYWRQKTKLKQIEKKEQ